MKLLLINIATVLILIAATSSTQAQEMANRSREKVHFSQQLEPSAKQQLADRATEKESRVFQRRVSGAELNRGVTLTTDADGAVIQISPLDSVKNGKRVVNTEVPRGMTLSNGAQRRRVDDNSIALHRKSQGLRTQFPGFYRRAHAMQVPADMGYGNLRLQAHGNAPDDTDYIVYALDKNSDTTLQVRTPKTRFSRGEHLVLNARASGTADIESISATLVAPGGERYGVSGQLRGGNYQVDWPIQVDAPRVPGRLWQVELRSTIRNAKGVRVERVAFVAADIFERTANLDSIYSDAQGLRLALDVQQPGRFEARALVHGRNRNGEYQPTLLSYQAEWLEAGQRELAIPIGSIELAAAGLAPPYRVQSLQLLDQSRMAVLEYRQGSWELEAP